MTEPRELRDFACRCGEERTKQMAELRQDVMRRLEISEESQLVTGVVFSLHWDFHVEITGIHTDQWSVITTKKYDETVITRVECDWIEDGFALTWKRYADLKEEDDRRDGPRVEGDDSSRRVGPAG